jgi:hypothetical protein
MEQGQKVRIINQYRDNADRTGVIVGMGHINVVGQGMTPIYLVELTVGFYNPDQNIYVSILPVHREALVPA